MDLAKIDLNEVVSTVQESNKAGNDAVWQLSELQLAIVGGGIGDVVPA